MKNVLVYDIEVFKDDNIAVFVNYADEIVGLYHNDYTKNLVEGRTETATELIEGKTLVGYNNHYYDDRILPKMLAGWKPQSIKALNDTIIAGDMNAGKSSKLQGTYDCFQQINVAKPSLKKIEANLGRAIIESDVDFTIERELTPAEVETAFKYCIYDTRQTLSVFKMREHNYFLAKHKLVDLIDNPSPRAADWNTTTISANILTRRPIDRLPHLNLGAKDPNGEYSAWLAVPEEVRDLWAHKEKGKVKVEDLGATFEFGFGGIHATNKSRKVWEDVYQLDVSSMYPTIISNLHILGYGDAHAKYVALMNERLKNKKTDPELAATQKIVINSVYGNMRSQYSTLFNPNGAKSVCFYGQSLFWQFAHRLDPIAIIVQANTDGIAVIRRPELSKEEFERELASIKDEFENEFTVNLEVDHFTKLYQRDVNNYVAVYDDGHVKAKGADVSSWEGDNPFSTNSLRIVSIAIVAWLLEGTDPKQTIMNNLDKPHLFQFVLQAGRTYKGTYDESGHKYQRINRAFAAPNEGVAIFKKRHDGGLVKFPNTPDKMLIHNEELYDESGSSEWPGFAESVDLNFYLELINDKLKKWER